MIKNMDPWFHGSAAGAAAGAAASAAIYILCTLSRRYKRAFVQCTKEVETSREDHQQEKPVWNVWINRFARHFMTG